MMINNIYKCVCVWVFALELSVRSKISETIQRSTIAFDGTQGQSANK